MTKDADDAQRCSLGLPTTSGSLSRRLLELGSLEIQAYDELFFPGLAAEWSGRFPFVGALTMELPADDDDEVAVLDSAVGNRRSTSASAACRSGLPPIQ